MKVLVSGWFSFDCGHATAGDVLAKDVVRSWLEESGHEVVVAATPPFEGDLLWEQAVPADYGAIVFVCGPFRPGWPLDEYLEHFSGRPIIGVNLSMLKSSTSWNPFAFLLPRDSDEGSSADITLASVGVAAPVVGLILVHPQSEYGEKQRHAQVGDAIHKLLAAHDVAVVPIDTRLDVNSTGLRTPAQVESLIARMDVVVTTRLHGLVLALKHGVPAVAVDPIAGGAKIKAQAGALGWPLVFTSETISAATLDSAFRFALSSEARSLARECRDRGKLSVDAAKERFIRAIAQLESGSFPRESHAARVTL